MNDLTIFNNPKFGDVRTIEENGKVFFCGNDVAKALGYADCPKAIRMHCKGVAEMATPTNGGIQNMKYIPEGDIYRLAAKSELPGAEEFENWIFDEVLPSIRKHGAYMTPETLQAAILNPDYLLRVVTALKDETDKRKALEIANSALTVDNQIMQPKAEYFDELVDRNLLTGVYETAKQLGFSPKKFASFLVERKYLYRDKKAKLMPYQVHVDAGLFTLKECFNDKTQWAGTQTLITPKGRETFRLLMLQSA